MGLMGAIISAGLIGGLAPPSPVDLTAVRLDVLAADIVAHDGDVSAAAEWAPPDFRQFPRVLGWNFTRGLFSTNNIVPLAAGAGGALIVSNWDQEISDSLRSDGSDFSEIGHWLGRPALSAAAIGALLVATPFTENSKYRSFTFTVAQAFIVDNVVAFGVKSAVGRERPNGEDNQSFYSGHTSNMFMWATVIEDHFGWKAGVPAYMVASLVGVSRVTRGSHWASDVIFGAAMGIISGKTASRGTRHSVGDRQIALVPIIGGGDRGVSVRLVF